MLLLDAALPSMYKRRGCRRSVHNCSQCRPRHPSIGFYRRRIGGCHCVLVRQKSRR